MLTPEQKVRLRRGMRVSLPEKRLVKKSNKHTRRRARATANGAKARNNGCN